MKLLALEIKNMRGVPDLTINPGGKNFLIWGPNGTGKSGVVDAIEFVLTGKISRLAGEGTEGITLSKYGVHITKKPEDAYVQAQLEVPGFDKPLEIKRLMTSPGVIQCPPEAKQFFGEIEQAVKHGQMVLTRRDILRYITARGGSRAQAIQELLNLDEIEETRKTLVQIRGKFQQEHKSADANVKQAKADVAATLGQKTYVEAQIIQGINGKRSQLGGVPITAITVSNTKMALNAPLSAASDDSGVKLKLSAVRTAGATLNKILYDNVHQRDQALVGLYDLLTQGRQQINANADLAKLSLIRQAHGFVNEATTECPLCGATWPQGHLLTHLQKTEAELQALHTMFDNIVRAKEQILDECRNLLANLSNLTTGLLDTVFSDDRWNPVKQTIRQWMEQLNGFSQWLEQPPHSLLSIERQYTGKEPFFAPAQFEGHLKEIELFAGSQYQPTDPKQETWDTLTRLEVNIKALERSQSNVTVAKIAFDRAKALEDAFEKQRNTVLGELYNRVSGRFVEFYSSLHSHETELFNAALTPQGASVDMKVEFLGYGMHPPHALHSEGHQDSMGLCLFLALNEELMGSHRGLIVLDDVMMSVDAGHRKDVCKLMNQLSEHYQFIVTTHDKTWERQLRQEKVIPMDKILEFTNWNVETGPQVHTGSEIWKAIPEDLKGENIVDAAFKLRRGSEEFFETVCDSLGARVVYNSTQRWELGDWLPAALERYKELLDKAVRVAKSWGNAEEEARLKELDSIRKQIVGKSTIEQWAINANVHYNNWANMEKSDFIDVVDAFEDLWQLFLCSNCGHLLKALPEKGNAEVVKCYCGNATWNLKVKS